MTHLKRLGALSLSLALTLTALSGCQNGASSSSQGDEPIDLASVTDPYLTTAGLSGDTVVARAGGADITAGSLLYWMAYLVDSSIQDPSSMDTVWELDMGNGQTFEQGILDASLNNAALYALLPIQAQAEGISVSPDLSQQVSNLMTSMETEAGSAELLDHSLWYNALTPELYTTLFEVNDLNSQLQEKLYGEGSAGYPTDDQVRSFAEGQGYYRAKHILLKTVDTNSPLTDENGNPTGEYEPLDEAIVAEKKALAEDLLAQLQAAGDKEALFDAIDTVEECLPVFAAMVNTLSVRRHNMERAAAGGFINATDCADYLVKKGMPFREAYMIVGRLVNLCIKNHETLDTLTLRDFRAISELFDEGVYEAMALKNCVNGRKVYGGPSKEAVTKQISLIEEFIAQRKK